MIRALPYLCCLLLAPALTADEYKPFGSFLLKSHFKITGDRITQVPMKPIRFDVSSDGVHVRITADGVADAQSKFEIYRSDGIGRQRPGTTGLDIIPGVQAMSTSGGVVRHLRLSRDALTITTFPGLSNQTIVSHAVPVAPSPPKGPAKPGEVPPITATHPPSDESAPRR